MECGEKKTTKNVKLSQCQDLFLKRTMSNTQKKLKCFIKNAYSATDNKHFYVS